MVLPKGLTIANCTVAEPQIMFGGHNKDGSVLIQDSAFQSFADFYDCWFMGPVILKNVRFEKGSNLLGMVGEPYQVKFDVEPVMENIFGNLHSDGHS
jgi:hypothetical protein